MKTDAIIHDFITRSDTAQALVDWANSRLGENDKAQTISDIFLTERLYFLLLQSKDHVDFKALERD